MSNVVERKRKEARLALRVDEELRAEIEEIAAQEDRTVSKWIERVLRAEVKRWRALTRKPQK